jgi:hypothetical protein
MKRGKAKNLLYRNVNFLLGDTMFEALDRIYDIFADPFKTTGSELNLAWTPELIGTGLEVLMNTTLTRFGETLFGLIGAGLCGIAMAFAPIGDFDKRILAQLAAHLGTRTMKMLEPENVTYATAEATSFGRALASYDIESVKNALVKSEAEIAATFGLAGIKIPTFGAPVQVTPPAVTVSPEEVLPAKVAVSI